MRCQLPHFIALLSMILAPSSMIGSVCAADTRAVLGPASETFVLVTLESADRCEFQYWPAGLTRAAARQASLYFGSNQRVQLFQLHGIRVASVIDYQLFCDRRTTPVSGILTFPSQHLLGPRHHLSGYINSGPNSRSRALETLVLVTPVVGRRAANWSYLAQVSSGGFWQLSVPQPKRIDRFVLAAVSKERKTSMATIRGRTSEHIELKLASSDTGCLATACGVRSSGFKVVWQSPSNFTPASVMYGESRNTLDYKACDARDTGPPCGYADDDTHYVDLSGLLQPDTTYYFQPLQAGIPVGSPCDVTTAPVPEYPPAPGSNNFGRVYLGPKKSHVAAGSFVKIVLDNPDGTRSAPLCSLVSSSGYWNVELNTALRRDLDDYFPKTLGETSVAAQAYGGADGTANVSWVLRDESTAPDMILNPRDIEIRLQDGWTLAGLSLVPQMTAAELCSELSQLSVAPERISQWSGSSWITHTCGYPSGDFHLAAGSGVFVKTASGETWSHTGGRIDQPHEYQLSGWTLVSLPSWAKPLKASELCADIAAQGGAPFKISRWLNASWQTHNCGLPINDYKVQPGDGVFIYVDTASTWTVYAPGDTSGAWPARPATPVN